MGQFLIERQTYLRVQYKSIFFQARLQRWLPTPINAANHIYFDITSFDKSSRDYLVYISKNSEASARERNDFIQSFNPPVPRLRGGGRNDPKSNVTSQKSDSVHQGQVNIPTISLYFIV